MEGLITLKKSSKYGLRELREIPHAKKLKRKCYTRKQDEKDFQKFWRRMSRNRTKILLDETFIVCYTGTLNSLKVQDCVEGAEVRGQLNIARRDWCDLM
jgi:hypothetical protein